MPAQITVSDRLPVRLNVLAHRPWPALFMLMLAFVIPAAGQSAIITIAGGGLSTDPLMAGISRPWGVALGPDGTVYWAANTRIMHRRQDGTLEVVAGVESTGFYGLDGFHGDGGPATSANLSFVTGLAIDAQGNIFISDGGNLCIRKVTAATGIITTVAGGGVSTTDGVAATSAALSYPVGISIDGAGNIFFADINATRIRRVDALSGIITTVAGNGTNCLTQPTVGDGTLATGPTLSDPTDVVVDGSGNLYITDESTHSVRLVTAATGTITTIAGTGVGSYSGDGALATAATLYYPQALALDGGGNVYIADSGNNRIRMVTTSTGIITTVAGTSSGGYNGDNQLATSAMLDYPGALLLNGSGALIIADSENFRIRQVNASTHFISTIAGNGSIGTAGDGGLGTVAQFAQIGGMCYDSIGDLYVVDQGDNRVRRISATTGIITTVVGTGVGGYSGDGGLATAACLFNPVRVAFDSHGNLIINDQGNNCIRRVATNGIISTIAGNGSAGFSGDGGLATAATLQQPVGLYVDSQDNIYITDMANQRVRLITASTGFISTIAGSGTFITGTSDMPGGFSGDGAAATSAQLDTPVDVILDAAKNIYIADFRNARIRMISASTGFISTIAGTGSVASTTSVGDGGQATAANLAYPTSLFFDTTGALLVSEAQNDAIRSVDLGTGIITTIVGSQVSGFSGDGGSPTAARLNRPTTLLKDALNNLVISDGNNDRLRKIVPVPTITWTPASLTYGTALGSGQLNASSGTAGTFVYSPAAGAILSAGSNLLSVRFTPTDTQNVAAVTVTASVAVAQAVPTITWTPTTISYGTALGSGQLNASASTPGSMIYSPVAGTILTPGSPTLHVTFTPTDTVDYTGATGQATLTVSPASLTIVADAQSRAVGAANPTLTYHLVGLVHGDSASVLSGTPVLSTNADANSTAGPYTIVVDIAGVTATNYTVGASNGTLTVTAPAGSGSGTSSSSSGSHSCGLGSTAAAIMLLSVLLLARSLRYMPPSESPGCRPRQTGSAIVHTNDDSKTST